MKHIMKSSLNLLMAAALAAFGSGCEKDAAFKQYVYPVPSITEFYPASGYAGSQVAISGTEFGDQIEAVGVMFGGVEVENILSCTNNRIIVQLPEGAQSGKIGLKVWNHETESAGEFTVIPTPVIASVVSDHPAGELFAAAGNSITITGSNFGGDPANVSVTIQGLENDVPVTPTEVTETEIKFTLPADYSEDGGTILLNIGGYELEAQSSLINPDAEGDVTGLFLKNYKQPFLSTGDSEWGTGLSWITSSGFGACIQTNSDYPQGVLGIQTGWGQGTKMDALLYQIATLPKGEYTFTVNVVENVKESGTYGVAFVVVEGVQIPLFNKEESNGNTNGVKQCTYNPVPDEVLAWKQITSPTISEPVQYTCSCTLADTKEVAIGFVSKMKGTNTVKMSEIKIERSKN